MTRPLARRAAALEARARGGWRAWAARPMAEWPDAALVAFLAHTGAGIVDAGCPTDAELRAIAAEDGPGGGAHA